MPANKNLPPGREKMPCHKNSDIQTCCSKCGELLENNPPPAVDDVFADDEFICPACCCGIYIEVRDE
ncbi:hypothetical protein ACOBQJ_11035 [Pelotomaculum propionicicum]|uniref:hypothetical protein n=1 Tax=Pelotomaculum propionicicum TaxID=258475 RepID=UPI003B7F2A37